ncbi:MAG: hypothetical protein WBK28_03070 [Minisyncoccia bacterium]
MKVPEGRPLIHRESEEPIGGGDQALAAAVARAQLKEALERYQAGQGREG